jgi:hypothetical protein
MRSRDARAARPASSGREAGQPAGAGSTKFELVVNFKTAKGLGLDVPLQLQQLTDEVIK